LVALLAVAVIISSPFSGWMLDHWSWRVMLVAEGSLPFLWLAIWLKFVQDHPAQAAWMPESERVPLVETLRREHSELEGQEKVPYLRALLRPACFCWRLSIFVLSAARWDSCSGCLARWRFQKTERLLTGILYTLPSSLALFLS